MVKRIFEVVAFVAVVCLVLAAVFVPLHIYSSQYKEYTIQLSELSDGVYAYRETVVSNIHANNYTMTTICDSTGNIYTIKGSARVVPSDFSSPHAVWKKFNLVNADEVTLYIPNGTMKYAGSQFTSGYTTVKIGGG